MPSKKLMFINGRELIGSLKNKESQNFNKQTQKVGRVVFHSNKICVSQQKRNLHFHINLPDENMEINIFCKRRNLLHVFSYSNEIK